ncbi:MAG: DHA3 family macrolide efflux protein-like MFS transporter [Alteromonadaceae bacterium]|jgi:DHA3 family macrolide efflux protein-like MFS transporter
MTSSKSSTSHQFSDKKRMQHFYAMWFGQLFSLVSTAITSFALGWWVLQETGMVTDYALIMVITFLPGIVLSPFIGILVDRHKRKTIMILADLVAGITSLFVAWLYVTDSMQVWHIYVVIAIDSVALAFQIPASLAGLTMLVPKKQLGRTAGMNQISYSLSHICAPFMAGFLLLKIGIIGILVIDLLTFVLAAAVMLFVTIPEPDKSKQKEAAKPAMISEIKAAWLYLRQRPSLFYLLGYFSMINFVAGILIASIMPLLNTFASESELGMVMSVGGLGALTGSLYMSLRKQPKSQIYGVLLGGMVYCFFVGLLGFNASLFSAGLALFMLGVTLPITASSSQVIWQTKVEPSFQGRVFALRRMVAQLSVPLGALSVGPLVDHYFQPMMDSNSEAAVFFGSIIGSGDGRGLGLVLVLAAILPFLISILAFAFKPLINIERTLPDALADSSSD